MTLANTRIDHLAIARGYASQPNEWPVAPRFNPVRRWCSLLADHPDYQVWLLTWLPGQSIDLHEHRGSGALYVLRGEIVEEAAEPTDPGSPSLTAWSLTARCVGAGAGLHFVGPHQHRIGNRSTRPAVSLHVQEP